MQPKISIIIPVYNVEKYVSKCLNSIINQTIKDIEIIVVDDGSTDSSGAICDDFSKRDSRIRVFHKENGGLSSARNFGLEKVRGDYIGFVDSDDYIETDMYELLLELAENNNSEMSICGVYDIYSGKPRCINKINRSFTVSRKEAIEIVLEAEIVSVMAVNKLYKRDLFYNVRYPVGKTAEDAFVIIDLLNCCERVSISTSQKYYYIHRSGSITTRKFNGNVDVIEAYEKNYSIIKERYSNLIPVAEMRLCWAHFYVLDHLLFDDREEYKDIKKNVIQYLNQRTSFILRNKQFQKSRKIAAILLRVDWRLYKICLIAQHKRHRIAD